MNHSDEIYSLLQEIELLEVKLAAAKERLTSRANRDTTYQTFARRNWLTILFMIGITLLAVIIAVDLQSQVLSPDAYFLLRAVAGVLVIIFVALAVWQIEQTNRDRQLNILRDLTFQKREIAGFRVEQGLHELLVARRSLESLLQK